MKYRRAVGLLNPMRDKNEGKNRGGEGTTPVTTACPEAGKYKCEKKQPRCLILDPVCFRFVCFVGPSPRQVFHRHCWTWDTFMWGVRRVGFEGKVKY